MGTIKKYLVVDVDGVLIPDGQDKQLMDDGIPNFSPLCLEMLHWIIEATGADMVISSSKRKGDLEYIRNFFSKRGFKYPEKIIGETIRGYDCVKKGTHLPIPRGVEIKAWIDLNARYVKGKGFVKKHGKDYVYAILDDNSDMLLEQKDYFVKTQSDMGLTEYEATALISRLN